jgi:hypothetical protein
MQRILLIRRNFFDNLVLFQALKSLPLFVCDIFKKEFIKIYKVSSEEEPTVTFRGVELEKFDKIFFLNTPINNYSTDDEIFAHNELDSSLLAILRQTQVNIYNKGLALSFNRLLLNPIPYCEKWTNIGWKVPSINYFYSIDSGVTKMLSPDPLSQTCFQLFITPFNYFISPGYNIIFRNSNDKFMELIHLTQCQMIEEKLEMLSFLFFRQENDFFIYGYLKDIPSETDMHSLAKLLQEITV